MLRHAYLFSTFVALSAACCSVLVVCNAAQGETLRHPASFETQVKAANPTELAAEIALRGDPVRGALLFHRSGAACASCHLSNDDTSPLGPNLSEIGPDVTISQLIESLTDPSKTIRKGFETLRLVTVDGEVFSGMSVSRDDGTIVLRDAADLQRELKVPVDDVELESQSAISMMPTGLINVIGNSRDLYDIVSYVHAIATEGKERARELQPTAEQLKITDDTANLDHATIIKDMRTRDFETGQRIYHGYCVNCHGADGKTPSLPTARAFGTQKLKFGGDPYSMFMTLSRGNGLMASMAHLTPLERYQTVHYIREEFMKDSDDFQPVTKSYLASLPKGTELGDEVPEIDRDFGPVLGSQLERTVASALTVKLDGLNLAYDLHSMDAAGVWEGKFLDLQNTQHTRGRGEGTANPAGTRISELECWQWGHGGTLDYATEDLPPRGPMPRDWMDYHGYYLHGKRIVLSYSIDGREVNEIPQTIGATGRLSHSLQISAGDELVLAVGRLEEGKQDAAGQVVTERTRAEFNARKTSASQPVAVKNHDEENPRFVAAAVRGDTAGLFWKIDSQNRLILVIPADTERRQIEVVRDAGSDISEMYDFRESIEADRTGADVSFDVLTAGGKPLWPDVLHTTGYPGLETGAYQLDTITIPDSTPWNTWFRTSAIDFFDDGRLVVTTYGGDVWIVSGVDEELTDLRWKRFAGGLYEPFGVKVIDEKIYVSCKDRITRLHDLNADGEADYYECFSPDPDVSVNFHAFNFDLQTDNTGNLYYAKSGHGADFDLPGAVYKVSPDGKRHEVLATGFRTPNGLGVLPDGRITASDNQGQWTPASKVMILKPGGYYGWVPTYEIAGMWSPGGGTIDLSKVKSPATVDPPLVYMPQELDSSSGGQLFADDPRWGPLSGRLLHTSFGKGWMYYLISQRVKEVDQAAVIKLPFDFRTGVMRGRVNPTDGQVYATGLDGWNGGARAGMLDQGIQRLRYRGGDYPMVTDCKIEPQGLRVTFSFELDAESIDIADAFVATQWNYRRQSSYGSERYSPSTGKIGADKLLFGKRVVSEDGKSVVLTVEQLEPVDQIQLRLKVKDQSGQEFVEEIYWTVNAVP